MSWARPELEARWSRVRLSAGSPLKQGPHRPAVEAGEVGHDLRGHRDRAVVGVGRKDHACPQREPGNWSSLSG